MFSMTLFLLYEYWTENVPTYNTPSHVPFVPGSHNKHKDTLQFGAHHSSHVPVWCPGHLLNSPSPPCQKPKFSLPPVFPSLQRHSLSPVASFCTLLAWGASWVITRGLRAGRLPLIESSQQIVFYETALTSQPARTCPDIIKDHTVSRRSLMHVRLTGFRTIPPFVTHIFPFTHPNNKWKKNNVDNMSKHAHCLHQPCSRRSSWLRRVHDSS